MNKHAVQYISIGENAPNGHWHIQSHSHLHYEMIVVVGGHEDISTAGQKFSVGAGEVILFKPGEAHEEWSKPGDPLFTYFMTFQAASGSADWPLRCVDQLGRIQLLSQWLHAERDSSQPEGRAAQESFFRALIREFVRLQVQSEDPLVASTRRYVRQNISSPLSVELLAENAQLSKFHFIRRYKQLCGRSPMEDVRAIRIGHARDIILTSNLPLKAIAPMAGLGDEISLYRLFRKHLGRTPGQLRRSARRQA